MLVKELKKLLENANDNATVYMDTYGESVPVTALEIVSIEHVFLTFDKKGT